MNPKLLLCLVLVLSGHGFAAIIYPQAPVVSAPTNAASPEPQISHSPWQPIVLTPDDRPAFPHAPEGFDLVRSNIVHGALEKVEYNSTTVGNQRKALVYLPPGYSRGTQYPVLYLLHGIGGDEEEWHRFGHPEVILDNLIADQKITPMIVVLPNGRAQPNDRAEGNIMASAPAFAVFEQDLLKDLIPAIEARYPVNTHRGTFHGRRPGAELRLGASRGICLDRRVFLGAEYQAAGAIGTRSRQGESNA